MLTLAWIDARHYILPDVLTLPLLIAGLCVTWVQAPQEIVAHALGAIAGYAAFRAIALLYHRLRGRYGLGEGDAKLLAAAGAWVGIAALPAVILSAGLIGIVMALLLPRAQQGGLNTPLPFGPALALAMLLVRLFPITFGLGDV